MKCLDFSGQEFFWNDLNYFLIFHSGRSLIQITKTNSNLIQLRNLSYKIVNLILK